MSITAEHVADKMTAAGLVALPRLAERWARDFDGGIPDYSASRYEDLDPHERVIARREWVVFGTGPYARKLDTDRTFAAIVAASLGDLAGTST